MPQPYLADVAWLTGFTGSKFNGEEAEGIHAEFPMERGKWNSTGYEGSEGSDNGNEDIVVVDDMFGTALVTKLARGTGNLYDPAVSVLDDYTIEFSFRSAFSGGSLPVTTFGGRVRIANTHPDDPEGVETDGFHYWFNDILVTIPSEGNKRHDFALVYSGNLRYTFVDGTLRQTKDMGEAAAGIEVPMQWGDASDNVNPAVYSFDEVRISRGALWTSDYIVRLPHPRTDPSPPPTLEPETTDLSFPEDIVDANVAGHNRQPQDPFLRAEVETGPFRVRRNLTIIPDLIDVSWTMSNSMILSFHLWFEGVLKAGQESFYLKIADPTFDSGVAWYRARFVEPYTSRFNVNDDWLVTAQLLLYGEALENRPPLSSFASTSVIALIGEGLPNSPAALEATTNIALIGAGVLAGPIRLESTTTIALVGAGALKLKAALEAETVIALIGFGGPGLVDLESETIIALSGTGGTSTVVELESETIVALEGDGNVSSGDFGLGLRLGESLGGVN